MKIVSITPIFREDLRMLEQFREDMANVKAVLEQQGHELRHFYLDDGALELPDEWPILVRHHQNEGLAHTLLEAYREALQLRRPADAIVRLDANEHDPYQIVHIVESFVLSPAQSIILPVRYQVDGQNRPSMKQVMADIVRFAGALNPVDAATVLEVYNQKFPMGYQAFHLQTLQGIVANLEQGVTLYETEFQKPMQWGLDLLTILLVAQYDPDGLDFHFGGWAAPWEQNRPVEKIEEQKRRAEEMLQLAPKLGCAIKTS